MQSWENRGTKKLEGLRKGAWVWWMKELIWKVSSCLTSCLSFLLWVSHDLHLCRRKRRSRASWNSQSKTSNAEPPIQRRQRLSRLNWIGWIFWTQRCWGRDWAGEMPQEDFRTKLKSLPEKRLCTTRLPRVSVWVPAWDPKRIPSISLRGTWTLRLPIFTVTV